MLPVAAAELLLQIVFGNGYRFHRDELDFRTAARHCAFGYDDQPPLTRCWVDQEDVASVEYHWTFTGTSADTGKWVRISGFEEWTIGPDGLIASSRGQYDELEFDRQLRESGEP